MEDSGRARLDAKVPQWAGVDGLQFPDRLCTEQCSGSSTALYKAGLLQDIAGTGCRVADLTGGLGVDCWAFSGTASAVLHNEMNRDLSTAVRHNFGVLGIRNVTFSSLEVSADNVSGILDGFRPDVVYMDPARRSRTGGKVFRISECVPNVLELIPAIFTSCGKLLLKLSPMADLAQTVAELDAAGAACGAAVTGIHIPGAGGECKEVLVLMGRPGSGVGGYDITVADTTSGATFSFRPDEEAAATSRIAPEEEIEGWLFEPGKALAKSGAFKLTGIRFGLGKVGVSTHLYVAREPAEGLRGLGKWFRITDVLPLDKRTMKECGNRYPAASVTARNIPLDSVGLRKRMGIVREGETHIFGIRSDCAGNILLICLPEKFS